MTYDPEAFPTVLPIADCVKPDGKTFYERKGKSLDGMYMYTGPDRQKMIEWAKAHCQGN